MPASLRRALVSVIISLAAVVSIAAELPVSYRVESDTLIADAPAGTVLIFALYEDSACSGALVSSQNFNIETLAIESVNLLKVRNAPSRPPKAADLYAVLTGLTGLPGTPYVKVTGTGVVPIGGVCQPQPASGSDHPMPETCPTNEIAVSTGDFSWECSQNCAFPTGDCNNAINDGCETNLATNADNCSACGVVCSGNNMATRTCSNFLCNGACNAGFADCNSNKLYDGCEISLATNPDHCGACGTVCSNNNMATRTCSGSTCNGTCAAGFSDCNNNKQLDGCETAGACPP